MRGVGQLITVLLLAACQQDSVEPPGSAPAAPPVTVSALQPAPDIRAPASAETPTNRGTSEGRPLAPPPLLLDRLLPPPSAPPTNPPLPAAPAAPPVVDKAASLVVPAFTWVTIPAGSLVMGATPAAVDRALEVCLDADSVLMGDEQPARQVTLTRSFQMTATEITEAQYAAVMGPSEASPLLPERGGNYPAVRILHEEAVRFCEHLTARTGVRHRLPTEAEWEYACRAGSTTLWSFGDDAEKLDQ